MNNYEFPPLSLILIEDQKDTREQLESVLKLYFITVYTASDGCEGKRKIALYQPDIIITDIKMPCLDGISMVKEVQTPTYSPIIIFTTAFSEKEYLLEAIDLQALAYLIKPINIHLLLDKIEDLRDNKLGKNRDLKYKKLSKREFQVCVDLAQGLKPSVIAQKYNIKPKTVSTYRSRIFEKMGFESNADLINYMIKNNLL